MALDQSEDLYPNERNMGFFDHIDELRKRLMRMALVLVVGIIVGYIFSEYIFRNIATAPIYNDFWGYKMYCNLGRWLTGKDGLCFTIPEVRTQNTALQGQFITDFKIALFSGLIATFPYIIYQIWKFVKPALSAKEIKKTQYSLFMVSLLFFTGIAFAYFMLLPLVLNFLMNYQISKTNPVENIYAINGVCSFIIVMCFATGLVFELPVLIYILARIGIVSSAFLKKYWRYAAVIIFIIAGIATPSPDIFSQLILGLPLMLLYVAGIFIAKRVEKNKLKEEEEFYNA